MTQSAEIKFQPSKLTTLNLFIKNMNHFQATMEPPTYKYTKECTKSLNSPLNILARNKKNKTDAAKFTRYRYHVFR